MQSHRLARKWMKRAADHGHGKAQFEHGLSLFSVRNTNLFLDPVTRRIFHSSANSKNKD